MKTGYLTMVEHPIAGTVPAIYVPAFCPDQPPPWPKPVRLWHPIYKDSRFLGWFKRNPRGSPRTGKEKPCKICGIPIYVTKSIESKQFCSQKCKNVQIGREKMVGVVF